MKKVLGIIAVVALAFGVLGFANTVDVAGNPPVGGSPTIDETTDVANVTIFGNPPVGG